MVGMPDFFKNLTTSKNVARIVYWTPSILISSLRLVERGIMGSKMGHLRASAAKLKGTVLFELITYLYTIKRLWKAWASNYFEFSFQI